MSVRARWIVAGVLGAVGIVAFLIANAGRNECNSFLGQLAQSDPGYHRRCEVYAAVWVGSLGSIGSAIAVSVAALIAMSTQTGYRPPPARFPDPPEWGSLPPSWAPGWYPDPWYQARLRWFDGTIWTDHVSNHDVGP